MPARQLFDRRAAWALGLVAPVLFGACSDDDSAGGGGSYSGTASPTTQDPTTGTTEVTPTTSVTATEGATDSEGTDTTSTSVDPTTTTVGPAPLTVDCGAPPGAAQGAKYSHAPKASGGVPGYEWSATGLPAGLTINANTGLISGVPTESGDFNIELTVSDVSGMEATTSCPALAVGGPFSLDWDALSGDGPCIAEGGGKTILDYVTGGDGSPITCKVSTGAGAGKLPTGLSVDASTCEIAGAMGETRYGSFAWIVEAEQAGVKVYAPYCAVQPMKAAKAYTIEGSHSGGDDNALVPLVVPFEPGQPLLLDGDADPLFEVTKGQCGDACFFGFLFRVTPSPLGTGACTEDADGCFGLCPLVADANAPDGDKQIQCSLLPKMGSPKIGFAHEMWAKGDAPAEAFQQRAFVVQWSIDYCLSNQAADCQGKDNILANGGGTNLEFPVIFRPQ